MSSRRPFFVLAVAAVTLLSACGASAPPAKELANEMVDTLDVSDTVKDCMHREIDEFSLTEEQATGFTDFDDVASKASEGNELALQIMGDFQSALATCR